MRIKLLVLFLAIFVLSIAIGPENIEAAGEYAKQEFDWIVVKKLTVKNEATFQSAVTIDGSADEVQLTVQGNSTQTENVFEVENSAGTAKAVIDDAGKGTFAGGLHLSGDGAGWMTLGAQTAISMTAGSTITPTGTWQPLESAAAVTSSTSTAVVSGTTSGDILIMQNTNASDAITIDGTGGNVECKADVVLGAGDTITLIWNGTNWYCQSVYDNS